MKEWGAHIFSGEFSFEELTMAFLALFAPYRPLKPMGGARLLDPNSRN